MSVDPLVLVTELDRATDRLLASCGKLTDEAVAQPSLLPDWTRGHVLTHLARQADALVNLFTWVRTGVVTPAYASPAARAADIEAGAGRPVAEQLDDLRAGCTRLSDTAHDLPAEQWATEIELPDGPQRAAFLPWRRLREVEVHHVDLLIGYSPTDWPESFAHRLLHEVAGGLGGVDLTLEVAGIGHPLHVGAGGDTVVSGSATELAAWLTGRAAGTGLRSSTGALPVLKSWI